MITDIIHFVKVYCREKSKKSKMVTVVILEKYLVSIIGKRTK